jgi:transcriptional regulator with XRE-family HTH domain
VIVKKLRQKNNWSQEQLAILCGVSLRTIQRVEAGNQASLETLKSLASVFEIEISKLTEEIIVIDKQSDEWKAEPLLLRIASVGLKKRLHFVLIEYLLILMGIGFWIFEPMNADVRVLFLVAYISSKLIAYIDKKNHW